jgi:threonine dehydratase
MADSITLADIEAARARIAGGIYVSPCVESIPLSQLTGAHVFCKLDYLQRTGSFKERGARNALLLLNDEQRKRGVIAASAGNHAQGIAYHGSLLGIPVTVVMPKFAALVKVTNCRHLGANVVLHGADLGESRVLAEQIAKDKGLTFIHPFDNANVMAGQGTMALEILEQTPDVKRSSCRSAAADCSRASAPCSRRLRPQARVVGVEPEHAACLTAARAAGHPVPVTLSPTLADGLAVPLLGKLPFAVLERVVDQVVTVDEAHIALAILRLIELEKSVVEGWRRRAARGLSLRASSTTSKAGKSSSRCAAATSTSRCSVVSWKWAWSRTAGCRGSRFRSVTGPAALRDSRN